MIIKKFSLFINENNNIDKVLGYHITRKRNLRSIKKYGIEPRVPEDFGENGDDKAVYLFKSKDDARTSLLQWMGDRIDEWEEETGKKYKERLLTVDLTGLNIVDTVEFEWMCIDTINPERILKIETI